MKKLFYYIFPFFKKKSIMYRYRLFLKKEAAKEERKDIRQWIKANEFARNICDASRIPFLDKLKISITKL